MWPIVRSHILLVAILTSATQGLLVVGPKRIRSYQNYTLAITNFNPELSKVDLLVRMEGSTIHGRTTLNITKSVEVQRNANTLTNFEMPMLIPADYKITIKGLNGFGFQEEAELFYLPYPKQHVSGLIQMNKPVFKPGELVQFRALVLDYQLKPPQNLPNVTVVIKDPLGNIIRKWPTARLHVGVFENKLLIGPSPLLGVYKIIVTSGDEELVSKTFEVKEYVLSTFDVDVSPATIPLEGDGGLNLTILATDYFGKPVKGKAILSLYLENDVLDQTKTLVVDGMGQARLIFKKPLVMYENQQDVQVNLTFIEQITNRTVTKQTPITVYKYMYHVELMKESQQLRPGEPYKCTIQLKYHDGTPAKNVEAQVNLKGLDEEFKKTSSSDHNGVIKQTFYPSESSKWINVMVTIGHKELFNEDIDEVETATDTYVKIERISNITLNQFIQFSVTCTDKMTFGVYYVVSQGNIVDADMLRPNNRQSFQLQINATSNMMPKSKIIVATLAKQIIVYDVMDIEFDELLNNFDMDIENKEVTPGGRIQLNIRGRPGSYVALAAYDKTLQQTSSCYDFSWHDVEQLYAQFHVNDDNEYDFFQGIGFFARVSGGLTLSAGMEGRHGRLNAPKKRIAYRTKFVETFLWKHDILQPSGRLTLIENVPHTITQWYLTGFSIHQEYGLGIIKKPIEFTTTKSFYITDHLPYSIKRGEPVQMIFTLFNYGSEATLANVTMYNVEDQIEFIGQPSGEPNCTKSVRIKSHESIPVLFLVKAKKLGEILVRVQASNEYDTDSIEKIIRVMPESLLVQKMESRFFTESSFTNVSYRLRLDIPKNADVDSPHIVFSMNPNLLFLMHNIDNLLSVPTGNGESNLVHFACNAIVLDYLIAIGSDDTTLLERATSLVRQGYQNQMNYRQKDGSFGAWLTSKGSVFLTAFVVKSMQTAAKHIDESDKTMITSSFEWLASKQQSSGRFNEAGQVLHSDMQGGLRNGVALTSYVLIAFMENEQAKVNHASVVTKGIEYVASMLPNVSDLYDLSIATYALMLNNHSQKDRYLQTLVDRSTSTGTMRYWAREPHGIETTAYALLAMVQAKRYLDGVPVMHWLVNQRYVSGSFPRTQDTFVGLKALSRLAKITSPARNDYIIRLKYQNQVKLFQMTPQDDSRMEFINIPSDVTKMEINVVGMGFGLLEVKYEYSVNLRNYPNRFRLQVDRLNTTSSDELQLKVCNSFIPRMKYERSNMALVEVTFPSGYIVKDHPIAKTTINPIRNVEILYGATTVVVYYDNMGDERSCFVITAHRLGQIRLKRPAYVIVRDYYDPQLIGFQQYEVEEGTLCELCDGDDCPDECMI